MKQKKWISGVLLSVLVLSAPVYAQSEDNDDEEGGDYVGCQMLGYGVNAAVIYLGTAGGATAWNVGLSAAFGHGMNYASTGLCNHVTEETVEGYENAMFALGIQVQWLIFHRPSLEQCLSIRRFDCVPSIPPEHNPTPEEQLFVQQSWEVVRQGAESLLSPGASNAAVISSLTLSGALADSFHAVGGQSLPDMYGSTTGIMN